MKSLKAAAVVIIIFILYSAASAQQENSDKFQEPPADNLTAAHDGWTLVPLPMIAYMPETSLLGSVALTAYNDNKQSDKKDNVLLAFYYTLKNQLGCNFLGTKYMKDESMKLSLELNAVKFPTKFYGIGNNVKNSAEETFEGRSIDIIPAFMYEIYRNLYVGPLVRCYSDSLRDFESGRQLSSGTVRGSEGIFQIGLGIIIDYDTRDSFSYPHRGALYTVKWNSFSDKALCDYSFNNLYIDLKNYFRIYGDHVIGINARYEMTEGSVPFQLLPILGGSNIMRGFVQEKYRDKHYAAVQAEYRFPLFWRIGGAAFVSAGDVAPEISGFDFHEIKTSGGLGMRINLDRKQHINLRLDLAYNSEGEVNFYLNLLEAF